MTGVLIPESEGLPTSENYSAYVPLVQDALLSACNDAGIQWLDVDRALWLIGSRGCVTRRCLMCPLQLECSVGRDVEFLGHRPKDGMLRYDSRPNQVQLH
jgi:hypothetical protein